MKAYGEPGELLFPIKPDDPSTTFAGYEVRFFFPHNNSPYLPPSFVHNLTPELSI